MQKNMEANTCNVNYLDDDALLPPRKRLLAGLKRQNSDVNSPASSTPTSAGSENDAHLNYLLSSHLSNPSISYEEIVEASRFAAIEAAKVAEAARANAEEKAEKAAKAVAAAKSALELVACLADKEKSVKKNKIKKHVPVEALYNKRKRKTNCRTDEELARNLHRAINSSPRTVKNSSSSCTKSHKLKRLKSNEKGVIGEVDIEGPIKKIDIVTEDLNRSEPDKGDRLRLDNGAGPSKIDRLNLENGEVDKFSESLDSFGKKRGRIKQKKLPLSICSFKDQAGPKKELKPRDSLMPVERTSTWKCQSFKAHKVMQS
ncbi:hypothetical protein BUALT_Bualt01G0073100 [Buddleja alternifolia]|uniref:Uncharacterized protein n=1 Tax=Buddleja alternifolia TaxID=168488 RepID=A0AAV6YD08_9LAMI|nr:hypothetical protein BUALT_Bualt01G0073100 [Buddleja alternifolia]